MSENYIQDVLDNLYRDYEYIDNEIQRVKKDFTSSRLHKLQDLERLVSMKCDIARAIAYLIK